MKILLRAMQKKKSGIPDDVLSIFEDIVQKHEDELGPNLVGLKCIRPEWDDEFCQAIDKEDILWT